MEYKYITIQSLESVILLTINRPDSLNALNSEVLSELQDFFISNIENKELKGIILTGAGDKSFVAGADIKEFLDLDERKGAAFAKRGQDIFFLIENFHVPVVAAVNGFALGGGCELAMACHLRVASENAKFGQPEVNLGLIPGYGGTQRLCQLIGKSKAMELLMTGDMISADDALKYGLVNYLVAREMLIEKCMELLRKIASKAPLAIKRVIECVNAHYDQNIDGYSKEYNEFGKCIGTADAKEGTAAFLEKRKPIFRGI